MMMMSTVNKQSQLHQLGALGNAKAPKEAQKHEAGATSPKLDLVDAKKDSFELSSASPREAVAGTAAPAPTVVSAPPAPKQNNFIALGSGIVALGSAIGAGFALCKAGVAEEGLTALKKEVADNKTLATGAETIAKTAEKLATEVGDAFEGSKPDIISLAETVGIHHDALTGMAITGNALNPLSNRILLGHQNNLNNSTTNAFHLNNLYEFLVNAEDNLTLSPEANTIVFKEALATIQGAVSHKNVTEHASTPVKEQATQIKQFVTVLSQLEALEKPAATAEAAAQEAFNKAYVAIINSVGKDLDDATKAELQAFQHKDASEFHDDAYLALETRIKDLAVGLKTKAPEAPVKAPEAQTQASKAPATNLLGTVFTLPENAELATFDSDNKWTGWKVFTDDELPAIKQRILGVDLQDLNYFNAAAILGSPQLRSDPELLVHVASALSDSNHTFASQEFQNDGGLVKDKLLPKLIDAASSYSIPLANDSSNSTAQSTANKLALVLLELEKKKDVAQTAETLAKTLKLDATADKAHIDLALAHHGSNTNVETIATYVAQQLNAIQDAFVVLVIG